MTIKNDFQEAAVEIFDSFESLAIDATYIKADSSYVAGGNLSPTENEYSLRLIRDTKSVTLTLASDIPWNAVKYLFITAELSVVPKVKDQIRIGTEVKSIVSVEADPGDIISILYVG